VRAGAVAMTTTTPTPIPSENGEPGA
jgi:hypothetical protein